MHILRILIALLSIHCLSPTSAGATNDMMCSIDDILIAEENEYGFYSHRHSFPDEQWHLELEKGRYKQFAHAQKNFKNIAPTPVNDYHTKAFLAEATEQDIIQSGKRISVPVRRTLHTLKMSKKGMRMIGSAIESAGIVDMIALPLWAYDLSNALKDDYASTIDKVNSALGIVPIINLVSMSVTAIVDAQVERMRVDERIRKGHIYVYDTVSHEDKAIAQLHEKKKNIVKFYADSLKESIDLNIISHSRDYSKAVKNYQVLLDNSIHRTEREKYRYLEHALTQVSAEGKQIPYFESMALVCIKEKNNFHNAFNRLLDSKGVDESNEVLLTTFKSLGQALERCRVSSLVRPYSQHINEFLQNDWHAYMDQSKAMNHALDALYKTSLDQLSAIKNKYVDGVIAHINTTLFAHQQSLSQAVAQLEKQAINLGREKFIEENDFEEDSNGRIYRESCRGGMKVTYRCDKQYFSYHPNKDPDIRTLRKLNAQLNLSAFKQYANDVIEGSKKMHSLSLLQGARDYYKAYQANKKLWSYSNSVRKPHITIRDEKQQRYTHKRSNPNYSEHCAYLLCSNNGEPALIYDFYAFTDPWDGVQTVAAVDNNINVLNSEGLPYSQHHHAVNVRDQSPYVWNLFDQGLTKWSVQNNLKAVGVALEEEETFFNIATFDHKSQRFLCLSVQHGHVALATCSDLAGQKWKAIDLKHQHLSYSHHNMRSPANDKALQSVTGECLLFNATDGAKLTPCQSKHLIDQPIHFKQSIMTQGKKEDNKTKGDVLNINGYNQWVILRESNALFHIHHIENQALIHHASPWQGLSKTYQRVHSQDNNNVANQYWGRCGPNEEIDAGLCYKKCRSGYYGAGDICLKHCPQGFKDLDLFCTDLDIQTKQSYPRGIGSTLICSSNEEQNGALCYPKCYSGFHGVGPVCWQNTPAGWTDMGLFFSRWSGYWGNFLWWKVWYPRLEFLGKKSYGRGVGSPLHACRVGEEKSGALCYPTCRLGFEGIGPVCWQACATGYHDDGVSCRRDNGFIKKGYTRGIGTLPYAKKIYGYSDGSYQVGDYVKGEDGQFYQLKKMPPLVYGEKSSDDWKIRNRLSRVHQNSEYYQHIGASLFEVANHIEDNRGAVEYLKLGRMTTYIQILSHHFDRRAVFSDRLKYHTREPIQRLELVKTNMIKALKHLEKPTDSKENISFKSHDAIIDLYHQLIIENKHLTDLVELTTPK